MKKGLWAGLITLFGSLALCGLGFGQIIENPSKPMVANAGRVVTLKEELRIEDTGAGFFFGNPTTIRVSPRGDIFFKDGQEQALLFDPKGRFVGNLFKKGQGPGEFTSLIDTWASPDLLYVRGTPPKILVYDYAGNLVQELALRDIFTGGRFILADRANLLAYGFGQPDASGGTGFRDVPWEIFEIATDGTSRKIGAFPIPVYLKVEAGGGISWTGWNQFRVVALDSNSLFLNATPEYLIENFVRDKKSVVLRFRRPYARVKFSEGGGVSAPRGNEPPPPDFWPDIYALHVVDGHIWVQTSTVTKEKGILFDVFDASGRYLDSFHIQSSIMNENGEPARVRMTIAGGCAYFREETGAGLFVIRKCRLVGL